MLGALTSRPILSAWHSQSTSTLLPVGVASMWLSSGMGSLQPDPLKLSFLVSRP